MTKKTHYAVVRGLETGVFTGWDKCKELVNGFSNSKYRGFETKGLAELWYEKNKTIYKRTEDLVYISENGDWDTLPYTENDKIYLSIDWIEKNLRLSKRQKDILNNTL